MVLTDARHADADRCTGSRVAEMTGKVKQAISLAQLPVERANLRETVLPIDGEFEKVEVEFLSHFLLEDTENGRNWSELHC